jgi:hypothetical protein
VEIESSEIHEHRVSPEPPQCPHVSDGQWNSGLLPGSIYGNDREELTVMPDSGHGYLLAKRTRFHIRGSANQSVMEIVRGPLENSPNEAVNTTWHESERIARV